MSSAYSDDGQMRTRIRDRVNDMGDSNSTTNQRINRFESGIEEPDTGVSITAELSDGRRDHRQRPDEDAEAIYELPDESDNRSSPPGTIGEVHDIMSENIESNLTKFRKFKGGAAGPLTVKEDEARSSEDQDTVSKEAHKSSVTKVSAVAVVSPAIAL